MSKAIRRFNARTDTVDAGRDLKAVVTPARPDPLLGVDGYTFGVATMSENAPHNGEMHPDGDEILYLISGLARVHAETDPPQVIEMNPGDGLIVPQGVWHRVDIVEPCQIVYFTPGPRGEYRPLED